MKKHFSFRQKLGGAFALLLSFILLQGTVSWFALTEINARFGELRDVEHIIELTLDARLNEKAYVKTGERRFAVKVQEELQQAEDRVNVIRQRSSSLEGQIMVDMSGALGRYMNTFSQYVIYQDQSMALKSESARISVELVGVVDDMREMNWPGRDKDINQWYRLLLAAGDRKPSTEERTDAMAAYKEIASLAAGVRQQVPDTDVKLAAARIVLLAKDYMGILEKAKDLGARQLANEQKMEAVAEDMLACGKQVNAYQNEKARERQALATQLMIAVFAISLLIALGGRFYLMGRLLKPLNEMAAVTSSLGMGYFNERIGMEAEDEFKVLLLSVNQMAENIENLNANMEQMVAERTRAFELEKARFEKFFENSPEGILIFDGELQVLNVNPAFTEIFGYTFEEIRGVLSPKFLNTNQTEIKEQLKRIGEGVVFQEEAIRRCKNGEGKMMSIIKFSFKQYDGATIYCSIYSDISERKATEEKLQFLSFYDSLTGLKNRTYFELEMGKLQQTGMACGIIVCDVDGLKQVNDTLGHAAGDQLLQTVAQILKKAADREEPARVGGDEFVILLPGASPDEIAELAASIKYEQDNDTTDREYPLSISVGYAYRVDGGLSMSELFTRADAMMYSEKRRRSKSGEPVLPDPGGHTNKEDGL
ncbi:MAG TPA: diguanylate cyclase [Patescibacteria group bacterium]|nr:diguanylate cyclase [Patescibacteria group bacterium]